ncbi:winged helix-turn-helix transcriptional regulator [Nocardia asteroides]|uniref:winged helix-turn-helix transcriptional regulator n=1 Tax=Nocardia asteroides TaxID=1824 RepID=UPI001E6567BB|nr:helix-turn-helix domain-containing protein [Nocardia asteroides]UGT55541.1 helix-turn-helix transcriptional regulator [Nocardia asteroides]
MAKRSYNQYCGLAIALDLLGERWSMLVLRNLLLGPQRFKDLSDGLPGIGTALLAERLKQLESAGVIVKATLPPPAASAVYQLTADGEALRPILVGLARWGLTRLGEPTEQQYIAPDLLALGLQARFDIDVAEGAAGIYELRIDDRSYRVEITEAGIGIRAGAVDAPRISIATDAPTLVAVNSGASTLSAALEAGTLTVAGDLDTLPDLVKAFGLPLA